MKKIGLFVFVLIVTYLLFGYTSKNNDLKIKNTIEGDFRTYYEMSDGTWSFGGHSYKYRLVISGRMPNAESDSTFVFLSNIENISFERAFMASGFSSNTEDYFEPEEAVFVGFGITERTPVLPF